MPSPIAHSLMGYCLYKDGNSSARTSWTTLALLVFLANCPDLDFLPGLIRGDVEAFHRVATHSLTFAVVSSVAVYLFLRLRRRAYAISVARAVLLGILSHLALDYFCASQPDEAIAILWPFSEVRPLSSISLFPPLSREPLIGWHNFRAALVEVSLMMVLILVAALFRIARLPVRRLRPVSPRRVRVLTER